MSKIEEIIIINPYGIADTVGKITTTSATSLRLFNCIQRTGQYAFQIWIRSVENLQPGNPVKIDINGDITFTSHKALFMYMKRSLNMAIDHQIGSLLFVKTCL